MQFISLLSLLLLAKVQADATTITQCDPVPTNTVAETPYTTVTQTMFANGKSVVGVIEHFQAIEYTEDCQNIAPTSSSIPHKTVTIF